MSKHYCKLLFISLLFVGCGSDGGDDAPDNIISVSSISISPTREVITVGETLQLSATVTPPNATNRTVSWLSSSTAIASVSSSGIVTAVAEGVATITAKAGDKSATCTITVRAATVTVSGITLNKTELTLNEGDNETLTATISPENATDKTVTWSSSDNSIATVDGGRIKAVKEGTATITAKAGDKSATCQIWVVPNSMGGGHEGTSEEQWN